METAFTRVVLPMPIFVLPPIIMSYLERYDPLVTFIIDYLQSECSSTSFLAGGAKNPVASP